MLKAAGKPGKATFTLKTSADGIAVGALAVDAGAMFVRGSAQLSPDAAMVQRLADPVAPVGRRRPQARSAGRPGDEGDAARLRLRRARRRQGLLQPRLRIHRAEGLRSRPQGRLRARAPTISRFRNSNSRSAAARARPVRCRRRKLGQGVVSARRDESGSMIVRAEDAGAFGKFLDFYTHPRAARSNSCCATRRRNPWHREFARLHAARSRAQTHGRRGAASASVRAEARRRRRD